MGTEVESFGNTPGVAAVWMVGGEEFLLSGCVVGGNTVIEGEFEFFEGGLGIALEEVQVCLFQEEVNMIDAIAAVTGNFKSFADGSLGLIVIFILIFLPSASCLLLSQCGL